MNKNRIARCAESAVGSNISGQPPSMTVMPCLRPGSAAALETPPRPKGRCIHTRLMPSMAHSRLVASAVFGRVPMPTASIPLGRGQVVLVSWGRLRRSRRSGASDDLVAAFLQPPVHQIARVVSGFRELR